jgi:hypothetical protein
MDRLSVHAMMVLPLTLPVAMFMPYPCTLLQKCIQALSCINPRFKSREWLADSNAAGSEM